MKKILFIILLIHPLIVSAHGGGFAVLPYYSICYTIFAGLILGLVEYLIFKKYSDQMIDYKKMIFYNYLILIPSLFISFIVAFIFSSYGWDALFIAILFYLAFLNSIKFILYKINLNLKRLSNIKQLVFIIIPNTLLFVLYIFLFFGFIYLKY